MKVKISDSRFYYNCTIEDISTIGFKAKGLPLQFDEEVIAKISLISSSCLHVKIAVRIDAVHRVQEQQLKDISFTVVDPPILWKEFIHSAQKH